MKKLCETCIHHEAEEDTLTTFFCNYSVQEIGRQNYLWELFPDCTAYVPEIEPEAIITPGPPKRSSSSDCVLMAAMESLLISKNKYKQALLNIKRELRRNENRHYPIDVYEQSFHKVLKIVNRTLDL